MSTATDPHPYDRQLSEDRMTRPTTPLGDLAVLVLLTLGLALLLGWAVLP